MLRREKKAIKEALDGEFIYCMISELNMREGSLASLARKGEKEWGVGVRAEEGAWLMRVFFFYKGGVFLQSVRF